MELTPIENKEKLKRGDRLLFFHYQYPTEVWSGFVKTDGHILEMPNEYNRKATHYCIAPEFPKKLTKFEEFINSLPDANGMTATENYKYKIIEDQTVAIGITRDWVILSNAFKAGQEAGPEESTNTEPEDNISKIISRVESGTREDYWFMNNHFSKDELVKFLKNLQEVFKV